MLEVGGWKLEAEVGRSPPPGFIPGTPHPPEATPGDWPFFAFKDAQRRSFSALSFLTCSDTNGVKVPNEPAELSKRWAETLIAIAVTGSLFGSVFTVSFFSAKKILLAAGLISVINMWSVRWSARLQNVLTVAKLVRS